MSAIVTEKGKLAALIGKAASQTMTAKRWSGPAQTRDGPSQKTECDPGSQPPHYRFISQVGVLVNYLVCQGIEKGPAFLGAHPVCGEDQGHEASAIDLQDPLTALAFFLLLALLQVVQDFWTRQQGGLRVSYPNVEEGILLPRPEAWDLDVEMSIWRSVNRTANKSFTSQGQQRGFCLDIMCNLFENVCQQISKLVVANGRVSPSRTRQRMVNGQCMATHTVRG